MLRTGFNWQENQVLAYANSRVFLLNAPVMTSLSCCLRSSLNWIKK